MIKCNIIQNLSNSYYTNICEICDENGHDVKKC